MTHGPIEIFVSRPFDDYSDGYFRNYLQDEVKKDVQVELKKRTGLDREIVFRDASRPRAAIGISEKVAAAIKRCDLLLALCFPKDGEDHLPPWISAEIGFGYAYQREMRAVIMPGVQASDLSFVSATRQLEALAVERSHYDPKLDRLHPDTHHKLVDWLADWLSSVLQSVPQRPPYHYVKYDKDVCVYPSGYGLVTIGIVVEVLEHLDHMPHFFQVQDTRTGSLPTIRQMRARYETLMEHGAKHADVFHFQSCSPSADAGGLVAEACGHGDMPEYVKRDLEADATARHFLVKPSHGRTIAPGEYRYEFVYGLNKMFAPEFRADATSATPRPVLVMEGSLDLNFMCPTASAWKRANALTVHYQHGDGSMENAAEAAQRDRSVRFLRHARGVAYHFRSVLLPLPERSGRLRVKWE